MHYYLNYKVGLCDHNQESNMGPSEQRELSHVVFFHQGEHKPDKPHDIHGEGNESVITDEKG